MKTLEVSIVFVLIVGIVASPVGFSFAQMPQQAQERMNEQAQQHMPEQSQETVDNLENFGMEVSNFVHDAMAAFHNQKQETIAQIKECRANLRDAEPSERDQIRQDCRANLDQIRDSYKEIRNTFHDTFKQFRESISVLRADAKGEHVSNDQKQAAMNEIRDSARAKHQQMGVKGGMMMNVDDLRQKIMSTHMEKQRHDEDEQSESMEASYVEMVDGVQVVTIHAKEFKFIPSELHIKPGNTKVVLVNDGVGEHELVVYEKSKKDIIEKAELEEDEQTIEQNILFEIEEVHGGESGESEIMSLDEGVYVIACHVPGHFDAGMSGTLEIES